MRESGFPEEYHGIGIRIEDDVIIGEDCPEVITSDVPVEITDLESIIGSAPYSKYKL